MDPTSILIEGLNYDVAHVFQAGRVLIVYKGLYVLVDQLPDGTWDLSGSPATPEEEVVLKTFTDPLNDKTEVKIVKDA